MVPSMRPLMNLDNVGGFLCDWHLLGPFDGAEMVDANARLWQVKKGDGYGRDHLAAWGGCAGIDTMIASGEGLVDCPQGTASSQEPVPFWKWDLLPLECRPVMKLATARQEYPAWQTALEGLDPDCWDKLYYALAVVESPRACEAKLVFCGQDGCRVWINGQSVFEERSYHHVIIDKERVSFALRKGRNTFLFQLDRGNLAARIEIAGDEGAIGNLRSVAFRSAPQLRRHATMVQLRRHAQTLKVKMPFTGRTPGDLRQWQENFGEHFSACLGQAPVWQLEPGSQKLINEDRREGFIERTYELSSEGGCVIECHVLIPDRPNGRALAVLHGHGNFRSLLADKPKGAEFQNYATHLARRGFLCGVICERGFGIRNDCDRPGDFCNTAAMMAAAQGLSFARLHIADIQVMYDLLASLPEADPARIGITGLSGGGSLTYLSAAFDQRFKAAGVFCGLCRYTEYAMGPDGCGMQTVAGVYPVGDSGEILSLIAPRPLLLGQGDLDATFHVIGVRSIASDAMRAYQAAGAADKLEVSIFHRAHEFDVDVAEKFFLKHL